MRARSWRPAPSLGFPLGLAVGVVALACMLVLLLADAATTSAATRAACTIGAVVAGTIFLAAALGAWWCRTLRYVLGPAALDVRFGSRVLRLPYDEIDEIVGRGEDDPPGPALWPGAHFGRSRRPSGGFDLWRGTSRASRDAVVVAVAGTGHVLTPAEPGTFRQELIENARSSEYAGSRSTAPTRGWLDVVAACDGWVRVFLFAAGVAATLAIAADVVRFGAAQPDSMRAASMLLINAIVALGISSRWPLIARLLAAGALAGQLLALL